jgi:hypothetical protein
MGTKGAGAGSALKLLQTPKIYDRIAPHVKRRPGQVI